MSSFNFRTIYIENNEGWSAIIYEQQVTQTNKYYSLDLRFVHIFR